MVDASTSAGDVASLDLALEAMYYGYQRMTAEPDARLRELGLARVHHRIVYFLARTPDCSVGGLINRMRVTKQYLNAPLRRLMAEGYVESRVDAQDRRIRRLRLTDRGHALEAELTGLQHALFRKIFSMAGPDAEQGWRRVMALLAAEPPGPPHSS